MLRYKEFIAEEHTVEVELDNVEPTLVLSHIDKANEDLDRVTAEPFVNSALFVNAVRGTLERYGIVLPAHSNMQQLSMEAEYTYAIGDTGHYVYIVHNLNPDGYVEGYAQIVDSEELEDLKELNDDDGEESADDDDSSEPSEWMKYPKARRDDDSGNTDEYA
jgi:hypothetical protein